MITILTADGTSVDLATVEIGGLHYTASVPVLLPPVELFPMAARPYCDPSMDPVVPTYSSAVSVPLAIGCQVWLVVDDWGVPGDNDLGWSSISLYVEQSMDGSYWSASNGQLIPVPNQYIADDSGQKVFAFNSNNSFPALQYLRVGYFAEVSTGAGGDWTTDQITFGVQMQQTVY